MDTQLKKGLLEVCVLKCLSISDSYGYEIINQVSPYVEISESTLYSILKRLESQKCLKTYKEEHNGRLRKYYKLTKTGRAKMNDFAEEYQKLTRAINYVLGEKS